MTPNRDHPNGRALHGALTVSMSATVNVKVRAAACSLIMYSAEYIKSYPDLFLKHSLEFAIVTLRVDHLEAQG